MKLNENFTYHVMGINIEKLALCAQRDVFRKIFVVKLHLRNIFLYIYCVRKYFYNKKKSELQYLCNTSQIE